MEKRNKMVAFRPLQPSDPSNLCVILLSFQCVCYFSLISKKKDKYRGKGKGRRCSLGDRIYSITCRASYLRLDDFEEYDELILFFKSSWCNSPYSSKRPGAFNGLDNAVY